MKSRHLPIVAIVTLGIAAMLTLGASRVSDEPNPSREIKELRNLVKSLENKIGDLEKRLKSVESRTNWIGQPYAFSSPGVSRRQTPGGTGVVMPHSGPPTIWSQGEVNGWPYYVVPANQNQSPAK